MPLSNSCGLATALNGPGDDKRYHLATWHDTNFIRANGLTWYPTLEWSTWTSSAEWLYPPVWKSAGVLAKLPGDSAKVWPSSFPDNLGMTPAI